MVTAWGHELKAREHGPFRFPFPFPCLISSVGDLDTSSVSCHSPSTLSASHEKIAERKKVREMLLIKVVKTK